MLRLKLGNTPIFSFQLEFGALALGLQVRGAEERGEVVRVGRELGLDLGMGVGRVEFTFGVLEGLGL